MNADPAKLFTADAGIRFVAKIWTHVTDSCANENVFIKLFVISQLIDHSAPVSH